MLHRRTPAALLVLLLSVLPVGAVRQVAPPQPAPPRPAASQPPLPEFLQAVKQRFAPDTRVAVFTVTTAREGDALVLAGEVDDAAAKEAAVKAAREAGNANVVDRILLLPDPDLGAAHFGVVTVSVGHMRAQPRHPAELVNEALMGTPVTVLKKQNGWYYAKTATESYLGWMEPDHVALMTREQAEQWSAAPKVIAIGYHGIIRETASATAPIVADVVMADTMKRTGVQAAWVTVELPDGRKGAIEQSAVEDHAAWKASRRLTPENIEKSALMFVGTPYLWGGTSPRGFDCSGFLKTVFRLNGVELPRDTDQQALRGENVSLDREFADLKKGDALFFGPRPISDRTQRITHTGIYVGNGEFIHCAGKVKRNSLDPNSPLYSENLVKRLVCARRYWKATT